METQEIKRITNLLETVYDGSPWHGESIHKSLEKVDFHKILVRSGGRIIDEQKVIIITDRELITEPSHNIVELVLHMTAWRKFVIEKLNNNVKYDISEEEDWTRIDHIEPTTWEEVKYNLKHTQELLVAALHKQDDSLLEKSVPQRKYNFYFLLHGIIQHDIYHLGQINLLNK